MDKGFENYVENFCLKEMIDVPCKFCLAYVFLDGVMPSTCFYSGYFLLVYLSKESKNPDRHSSFIHDFCTNYQKDLPARTNFVTSLKAFDSTSFVDNCLNELSLHPGLNSWFSPIDALPSISSDEICSLHKKLFDSLHSKGISSLAEYVSFSNLVSLDLYLNAFE